ncbi:MAG: carbohydrate binding family 9 domain-containing protein [Bacteroidetes bacterium]|nr:carbohydrate binding family 9 domain-containing protein [Bacteroidota bacterium]
MRPLLRQSPAVRVTLSLNLALLGVLLPTTLPAQAQERSKTPSPENEAGGKATVVLPRLDAAIVLDGPSDEAAWDAIAPLPMTVFEPVYEGTATERTEIRVAYDDNYVYVAGRLYDSDPSGIRGNSLYRDRYSGDDVFSILLDTFNDNENALWFFTNPNGVRFDFAVSNDAEFSGGSPFGGVINNSWNTFWDVATVKTDEGWFAEMRIPFSSLGFQDTDGQVVMGMIVYRLISRKNERHIYPAIPPNWGLAFGKPSQAQDVVLEGVRSQKPLYVTPYLLGGVERAAHLNDAETAFAQQNNGTSEVGLDVKYNLTSNLTLDATLNTDFAQVEADNQQVNLTRFSLFFPEKRQFFQQRAGIFEFNTGGLSRLFHSRRIGLDDDGNQIRIYGGARLVGRLGSWDVGLIDMQTARFEDQPSENFGVLRLRRNVFNENSYAGGMVTSRLGTDGSYNLATGLDGIFRVTGDEYLTVQWAQTFEDEIIKNDKFDLFETALLRVNWQRRRQQGFNYSASATWSGSDYDPGMGFILRNGFTRLGGEVAYDWLPGESSSLRRVSPSFSASVFLRNDDLGTDLNVNQAIESAEIEHFWTLEFRSGDRLFVGPKVQVEDLEAVLAFPEDTEVPAGRYTFYNVGGLFFMHDGRLLRANFDVEGGTFYDGHRLQLGISPTWNVSRFLELSAEYRGNFVRFPDRGQRFEVHVVRLRTQAALNTKVSTNFFLQYNSAADAVSANVRFRYNFREGNDLWIVYNQSLNTDRHRDVPALPFSDNSTILLKYTHTFGL